MEEPVRIHLWGKIVPTMRGEAVEVIRAQAVLPSEIELRKAVMESMRAGRRMQISSALGYQAALQLAAATQALFKEITFSQEGYDSNASYCSKHNFYYGGILGCHLCNDFYQK